MHQPLKQFVLRHEGLQLVLMPSKIVWCPEEKTIFIADTHFGKASTFRKSGIAVPRGTTAKMLSSLSSQIELLEARSLIVLGDLVHSNVTCQEDFERELLDWRTRNDQLKVVLVKGNHDTKLGSFYERLEIELQSKPIVSWGQIDLCHNPKDASNGKFSLCGHIHPAISIGGSKLNCFWLRENKLVLPAFGAFTGTARITLAAQEIAFAICEDNLIKITA